MDKMVDLAFFQGKRVFITGHTGFKGGWLAQILVQSGAVVSGYALAPNTSPNLYGILGLQNRINSVIGDIRDFAHLKSAMEAADPEIVFHLAAQPLVRCSYSNPVETYSTNVMGTVNVLECCRALPRVKSIVNVTTDKVYLNKEWSWGYRENEELCGYDPYSNSKSCSELVTFSYKNSFFGSEASPAVSTARSGNVIGGGDFSEDRIIPDCVKAAFAGNAIAVRNPQSTRPYQHVLDCLSGYLRLAQVQYSDKKLSGCYNFGPYDTDCVTTGDLVDKFCHLWGDAKWSHTQEVSAPHEANFLKLDISKAQAQLQWSPTWGIDKALSATVAWYRAFFEKSDIIAVTKKQIEEFFQQ